MKDKILGIVHKHIIVNGNDIVVNQDSLASEIADMVKAFTKWCINKDIHCDSREETYYFDAEITFYTLDELFDYWFNNIRKK